MSLLILFLRPLFLLPRFTRYSYARGFDFSTNLTAEVIHFHENTKYNKQNMCEPITSTANHGCDCVAAVTEINILCSYNISCRILWRLTPLKKKLSVLCPCGFTFNVLNSEKDSIAKIRLHFERFHKNFLPFGITNDEALSLLKKRRINRKQKRYFKQFPSSRKTSLVQ